MANSNISAANSQSIVFDLYRYQIIPIDRNQKGLFDEPIPELIANKNRYFHQSILSISQEATASEDENYKYKIQIEEKQIQGRDNGLIIFRLAKQRIFPYDSPDFERHPIPMWPWSYVIVWNEPDRQVMAIQHKHRVTKQTITLINWLAKQINKELELKNLVVHIKSIYDEKSFWDIAKNNEVEKVTFTLITPNMANISSSLSDDMKNLAKTTNAQQSKVELAAYQGSTLDLEKDNKTVNDLVGYSSQGGGDASFKIKGLKTRKNTKKSTKKIHIDEIEVKGYDIDKITKVLRSALD